MRGDAFQCFFANLGPPNSDSNSVSDDFGESQARNEIAFSVHHDRCHLHDRYHFFLCCIQGGVDYTRRMHDHSLCLDVQSLSKSNSLFDGE